MSKSADYHLIPAAGRVGAAAPTYVALTIATLLWGASYAAYKVIAIELGGVTSNAARFVLGTSFIMLCFLAAGGRILPARRDLPLFLLVGAAGPVLSASLLFTGLTLVSATEGTLFMNLNALIIAVLAALFLGEPLTRRKGVGGLISFAGLAGVLLGGVNPVGESQNRPLGLALVLLAAFFWSVYVLLSRAAVRRYAPFDATTYTFMVGTLLLVPMAMAYSPFERFAAMSSNGWIALIFAGTLGGPVPFLLWNRGVQSIGASRTAIFNNAIPVWTAVIAAVVLGDRLMALQWVGATFVVGGVALVTTDRSANSTGDASIL